MKARRLIGAAMWWPLALLVLPFCLAWMVLDWALQCLSDYHAEMKK